MQRLSRDELVERVVQLQAGDWETDSEMDQIFAEIDGSVPCPFAEIQGFIFHLDDLEPCEIVERMLSYRAIQL